MRQKAGLSRLFSVGRICKALGTAHLRSTCRRGIVTDKNLFMEGVREHGETYFAIDLKSFYASVECMERGLDPMTTNLVVADKSRTEKTICLAVSPSLKAYGVSGRARLFEVVQRVEQVNRNGSERPQAGGSPPLPGTIPGCRHPLRWALDYL